MLTCRSGDSETRPGVGAGRIQEGCLEESGGSSAFSFIFPPNRTDRRTCKRILLKVGSNWRRARSFLSLANSLKFKNQTSCPCKSLLCPPRLLSCLFSSTLQSGCWAPSHLPHTSLALSARIFLWGRGLAGELYLSHSKGSFPETRIPVSLPAISGFL